MCSFSSQCSYLVAYNVQFQWLMFRFSSLQRAISVANVEFQCLECAVLVPYNVQYICNPLLPICFFNLL
jgi:hypothetical protein